MRFDVVIGPRAGSARYDAFDGCGQQVDGVVDDGDDVAHDQKDSGEHALHGMSRVGAVAAAWHCGRRGGILTLGLSGQADQRGQVVGQHLGRHVDDERLLAQPRNRLQVISMLEAFECFLNFPAGVVQVTEAFTGEIRRIQVDCQHPQPTGGRDVAHHAKFGSVVGAQPQSTTSCALGAFTVTCACSAPERRNRLTADQPLSLSQRITKRMPRSHSSETNQAAGQPRSSRSKSARVAAASYLRTF